MIVVVVGLVAVILILSFYWTKDTVPNSHHYFEEMNGMGAFCRVRVINVAML